MSEEALEQYWLVPNIMYVTLYYAMCLNMQTYFSQSGLYVCITNLT